jgi:hypothetical protein
MTTMNILFFKKYTMLNYEMEFYNLAEIYLQINVDNINKGTQLTETLQFGLWFCSIAVHPPPTS